MMKPLQIIIIISLFLLMFGLVSADETYDETGFSDNDFEGGSGLFTSSLVGSIVGRGIGNNQQTPLVSDLDNDNISEIIVMDGSTLKIYHYANLTPAGSLATGLSSSLSNMISYDIDGDGFKEIIVAEESAGESIIILNYTNSTVLNQTSITYKNMVEHTDGEVIIKCRDTNDCGMAISKLDNAFTDFVSFATFNTSEVVNGSDITPSSNALYCFPKIKLMEVDNLDADEEKEYVFSATGDTQDEMYVFKVDVANNLTITGDNVYVDTTITAIGANGDCSVDNFGMFITPPTVAQTLGAGQSEIIYGIMVTDDDFKIRVLDASLNLVDTFPAIANGEGIIVSNVLTGKFFPDSAGSDFCVVGYSDIIGAGEDSRSLDIKCGSRTTGENPNSNSYILEISEFQNPFNVSQDYGSWDVVSQSSNHDKGSSFSCGLLFCDNEPTADLDEIINAYGIIKIERTGNLCGISGTCEASIVFEHNKGSGAMISTDVERTGFEDLILLTDSNIFYFDDAFENSPAIISNYDTNPCIDSGAIKINTTFILSVVVTDADSPPDNVQASATIYQGTSNEQFVNFSEPFNSGSTFSFTDFKLNATVSNGILRIEGRDVENQDINTLNIPFSVGINGVEFGDCTTEVDIIADIAAAAEFESSETDLQDNSITSGLRTGAELFGLSELVIFLVIMLFVAFAIWSIGHETQSGNPIYTFGTIIIVEVLLVIVGTLLGIIPVGIVITFAILGLVVVGMWMRNIFAGTSTR